MNEWIALIVATCVTKSLLVCYDVYFNFLFFAVPHQ